MLIRSMQPEQVYALPRLDQGYTYSAAANWYSVQLIITNLSHTLCVHVGIVRTAVCPSIVVVCIACRTKTATKIVGSFRFWQICR